MRTRLALVALCAVLLLRCGPDCGPSARCEAAQALPVLMESLGPRVAGVVQLRASADGPAVSSVDFALDGAPIATAAHRPWSVAWDTVSAENGAHTLNAIAHGFDGAAGTSPPLAVSVLNPTGASVSIHTALGLPGRASTSAAEIGPWLSVKPQYVVSYDGSRRVPAWVSWQLSSRWLGPVPRQDDFRPDDTLPAQIPQAQLSDYAGSGWDRGHLCPSEDRTATVADNRSTFYLTNVVPQADSVNVGPWEKLEWYLRGLAFAGRELAVVAGGVFRGPSRSIGGDAVAVPSATFKVAVVLDGPGQGFVDVTPQTRVIAVLMPNEPLVERTADWRAFRVRPREIESLTGLRLFSDVAREVRERLIDQLDTVP